MELKTEIVDEKQQALIVFKNQYSFITLLKDELKRVSIDAFYSPFLPKDIKMFNYVFIVNEHPSLEKINNNKESFFIYIFFGKKNHPINSRSFPKNIKIVTVNGDRLEKSEIDRILWFAFSKSNETSLNLNLSQLIKNKSGVIFKDSHNYKKLITRKNVTLALIFSVVILHFIFIPFLFLSLLLNYRSYLIFKKSPSKNISFFTQTSQNLHFFSKKLYSIVRPSYLLFGMAILPDNLIDINEKSFTIIKEAESLIENVKGLENLLFQSEKSGQQKIELTLRIKKIKIGFAHLQDELNLVAQKIPTMNNSSDQIKKQLSELSDNLQKVNKVVDYFQGVLIGKDVKKYVIFFANNMELRPGGGFIGSFGILEIGNFNINNVKVYDVYDADGQLTVHLDPPKPIAKYLNVPHWFFRDSNFSPDFFTNYQKALFFLEKEMKMTDFSGGILLTTTAVENILSAFNDLYLPDFKEYINSKNFYLKTQQNVEKNFFPGSIQKKVFLSSLLRQLQNNFNTVNIRTLFSQIKKSLDEKQITLYFEDKNMQSFLDSSFWSGRVIDPKCTLPDNCITDFIFPYDANVGANKANFFVNRFINQKVNIDSNGKITHYLSLQYKNESPAEIFPTGYYRNYFQILLPRNSTINQVTKDGILVEDIDQIDDQYKLIGFLFELGPGKTTEIKINYQLDDTLKTGHNIYQLIVQKQIGAKNSDLILEYQLGKNISVLNQNFSPIVKDNQIIYNTSLSADKIFLIELTKE